jgi:hypothetical protein
LFVPEQPNGSSFLPGVWLVLKVFVFHLLPLPFFCFDVRFFRSWFFQPRFIHPPPFFQSARPEHFRGLAVVSHSIFRFILRTFNLAGEAGTSMLPVPPILAVSFFSFWRGSTPPQSPIFGLGSAGNLYCLLPDI